MDDTALLEAIAQARDTDAFAELCRRYTGRLCSFVRGRGLDDAESVVQDVMLTIWRRAGTFDPTRAAPATWIFTITRNRSTDLLRKRQRPTPDPRDPAFVTTQATTSTPAPDKAAEQSRQLAAIERAMDELPNDQRELLALVYIQGTTIAEAAKALQIPLGTAKSRIRLALASVRTHLSLEHSHG
ncbi:RNA polymerase sigma-70 factor [Enhygromyxa salina]|uniref:RNA polymerase sigma-70 factor n=1 Tax=Enhygromyxa salina TaxID=215803 RepID=A0A0C2D0U9_9BACT|nr:sigma-70 family RNA polymerase sigma factor [Enhygromyxa salina]KIG16866.1 RNA polymerase sigma-70 factor [Enhygromyxa salina]